MVTEKTVLDYYPFETAGIEFLPKRVGKQRPSSNLL
jgi:hypothetical protein